MPGALFVSVSASPNMVPHQQNAGPGRTADFASIFAFCVVLMKNIHM